VLGDERARSRHGRQACETPQRQWEVESYIPRNKPVLIYGDGGVGKSTLAMQLGVAKSANTNWLGIETRPGSTLYLSAEDDLDELHIRLNCIRNDLGLTWDDLADVHLQSLVGKDPTLGAFSREQWKVIKTPLLDQVEEYLRDLGISTVILDTLSDVFAGEENDKQQARGFVNLIGGLALRTQSTIVALAHPSLSGMSSGAGTSGSVAWNNTVRARLYLNSDKDDETARLLQVMKANYGPKNLRVRLRWQRGVTAADPPCRTKKGAIAPAAPTATALHIRNMPRHAALKCLQMAGMKYGKRISYPR
jgi:RecA-family ATPase